jgi:hypothetical protein
MIACSIFSFRFCFSMNPAPIRNFLTWPLYPAGSFIFPSRILYCSIREYCKGRLRTAKSRFCFSFLSFPMRSMLNFHFLGPCSWIYMPFWGWYLYLPSRICSPLLFSLAGWTKSIHFDLLSPETTLFWRSLPSTNLALSARSHVLL